MKIKELRQKSEEELKKGLRDNQEKLRQLRFIMSASKVKDVREIRKIKKEIAQILTLITESRSSGTSRRTSVLLRPSLRLGQVKKRTESSSPKETHAQTTDR